MRIIFTMQDSVKRVLSGLLYGGSALLLIVIALAELSRRVAIPTGGKLILSGLVIVLLTLAGMLRNASLTSAAERTKTIRRTLWVMFFLYLFYLSWMLFFDSNYNRTEWQVDFKYYIEQKTNFTPFVTIQRYLHNITRNRQTSSAFLNLAGNLAAFMPMSFFAPLLLKPARRAWIFIPSLLLILAGAEGLQLLMRVGSCDVDDVILNLAGALIVYGMMKLPPVKRGLKKIDYVRK